MTEPVLSEEQLISCIRILESVKFGLLKLGPLCNASESNSFTSARCNMSNIKNGEKQYFVEFKELFKKGISFF